jgi:hypothetical protein
MPGADLTDSLLKSCSFRAEKLLKARGSFNTVLWLAQYPDGHREWFETNCAFAPDAATDAEVLTGLAADTGLDFAATGVVRFAVAYLGNRVTVIRPVDPESTMETKTTRIRGVVIELYGAGEYLRIFREIIHIGSGKSRQSLLGAAVPLDPDADSPYANVLNPQACDAAMDQILGETQ